MEAFGEDGYPVSVPDTTPPIISLSTPMDGDAYLASPIPVNGNLDEAAFSVTVNGVAASVGAAPLVPFLGDAALAPGANTVTVTATDLACNESTLTVSVTREEVDLVAPVATLSAPSQVQASQVIRATATAEDDDAVASVAFLVDGLEVKSQSEPPYELSYNAPAEPGSVLEIQVVATDPSGNQAVDCCTVKNW